MDGHDIAVHLAQVLQSHGHGAPHARTRAGLEQVSSDCGHDRRSPRRPGRAGCRGVLGHVGKGTRAV